MNTAMTTSEAAAALGVAPDTIRHLIHLRRLEARKHGRDWWIERAEVERYRASRRPTVA